MKTQTLKQQFEKWNDFTKEGVLAFIAQELTLLAEEINKLQGTARYEAGAKHAAAIIRAHVRDLEE